MPIQLNMVLLLWSMVIRCKAGNLCCRKWLLFWDIHHCAVISVCSFAVPRFWGKMAASQNTLNDQYRERPELVQYHTWKPYSNQIHYLSKPPANLPSNWQSINQHENLILLRYICSLNHQQIYQVMSRVSSNMIISMLSLHIDNSCGEHGCWWYWYFTLHQSHLSPKDHVVRILQLSIIYQFSLFLLMLLSICKIPLCIFTLSTLSSKKQLCILPSIPTFYLYIYHYKAARKLLLCFLIYCTFKPSR